MQRLRPLGHPDPRLCCCCCCNSSPCSCQSQPSSASLLLALLQGDLAPGSTLALLPTRAADRRPHLLHALQTTRNRSTQHSGSTLPTCLAKAKATLHQSNQRNHQQLMALHMPTTSCRGGSRHRSTLPVTSSTPSRASPYGKPRALGAQCCLVDGSWGKKRAPFFPARRREGWARRTLPHQPLRECCAGLKESVCGKGAGE